jgi:hypothetical protein
MRKADTNTSDKETPAPAVSQATIDAQPRARRSSEWPQAEFARFLAFAIFTIVKVGQSGFHVRLSIRWLPLHSGGLAADVERYPGHVLVDPRTHSWPIKEENAVLTERPCLGSFKKLARSV